VRGVNAGLSELVVGKSGRIRGGGETRRDAVRDKAKHLLFWRPSVAACLGKAEKGKRESQGDNGFLRVRTSERPRCWERGRFQVWKREDS